MENTKITILYRKWYSFHKLASWIAEYLTDKGFDVPIKEFSVGSLKSSYDPFLFITGGGVDSQFMRLCDAYQKKGAIWIDVFFHTKHSGFVAFQKGFRHRGGRLICTSDYDRHKLEANNVVVDAVIPRCIPDRTFDYTWQGKKKTLITVGVPDLRKEAAIFKWSHPPDELKKASRKGHEYLVKFAENNPDWIVTLVSRREQLKKICGNINLSNLNILESGSLSEYDLYTMIANSGVYAHPCRYEPFGLGIVEAQAIGVPTCFTALPQQTEIGGGIMIPFKENYRFPSGISLAIIDYVEVEKAIYKCYDMADSVSAMCRENAQKFRVSNIVKKLIEVTEK